MPVVSGAHVAERRPTGVFSSPLREHFVNLRQSLRPMPVVNGAHVAERRPMTGRPLSTVSIILPLHFIDHVFFLRSCRLVRPAGTKTFFTDLEEESGGR